MSKQWARQEVHKNELAEVLEKGWAWTQGNRRQASAGAGILAALLLAGGYFAYQHWVSEKTAWQKFSVAQSYVYQGDLDKALSSLEALSVEYRRTRAGGFGILLEGDILYKQGKFQQAAAAYQKILERQAPKSLLPFALSGLGLAQEAGKDYTSAVETDRRFLDLYKDSFLAPQTHASLARSLEALGRGEEAKAVYQQMTALYSEDAYWSQWAQSNLKSP